MELLKRIGEKLWLDNNGNFGRNHDLPAICGNNDRYWIYDKKFRRKRDLPSTIYNNGEKNWSVRKETLSPIIIQANGTRIFKN